MWFSDCVHQGRWIIQTNGWNDVRALWSPQNQSEQCQQAYAGNREEILGHQGTSSCGGLQSTGERTSPNAVLFVTKQLNLFLVKGGISIQFNPKHTSRCH